MHFFSFCFPTNLKVNLAEITSQMLCEIYVKLDFFFFWLWFKWPFCLNKRGFTITKKFIDFYYQEVKTVLIILIFVKYECPTTQKYWLYLKPSFLYLVK